MSKRKDRFIELTKWNAYHDWPTVKGLRRMREFQEEKNCQSVFKKVNGRVLVDENAFFEWVKSTDTYGVRHEQT